MTEMDTAPEDEVPPPPARSRIRIPNWIRHPLWWMPDIPAEQERAFGRIWADFEDATVLDDGRHDSASWTRRSGDFVLCCVRIPVTALAEAFTELRDAVAALAFARVHPPQFLHIAIQELGFVSPQPRGRDEFSQARLDEFLGYIEAPIGDFNPFTVELGGANSFQDAAFLEVRDNGWLSRIHFRMRDFVIIPPNKHFPYLPFATFAHYTGQGDAATARETLAPWRQARFASFQVREIDVVRIPVTEPYPPLEVIRTIRLGRHRLEAPVRPLLTDPSDDGV